MTVLITTEQIASKILELVSASSPLSGVRLGVSIRDSFPGFTPRQYRCRNLRQFIQAHVPSVGEQGDGINLAYAIVDTPRSIEREPVKSDVTVTPAQWKAFTHPTHPYLLMGNPETGELRVLPNTKTVVPPWVTIPKCTSEALHSLASNFVSRLAPVYRVQLEHLLKEPRWYIQFHPKVAQMGFGVQWNLFRRDHLMSMLSKAISDAGIDLTKRVSNAPRPLEKVDPAGGNGSSSLSSTALQRADPFKKAPELAATSKEEMGRQSDQNKALLETAKRLLLVVTDILNTLDK